MYYIFNITPVPKPRMTRADTWKKRACVQRYWAYKDELIKQARRQNFVMPESDYHIKFFIPMPATWPQKKKDLMRGTPHRSTPDKDNLEKAFLDALCESDSHIWDGRVTKLWGETGVISVLDSKVDREARSKLEKENKEMIARREKAGWYKKKKNKIPPTEIKKIHEMKL